ncbi:hypothetical protein MBOE_59880 [Mycolicibacterium boenickei]|uniref:Uncharacterized protein n=1 Tax=Mycolicibacterium boenickei TaxID=146017 RepID=A0ABM7J536_9MYCO|nr:hypothetical protein MBOE_59880 [Mycolicibacterium boenickei]
MHAGGIGQHAIEVEQAGGDLLGQAQHSVLAFADVPSIMRNHREVRGLEHAFGIDPVLNISGTSSTL